MEATFGYVLKESVAIGLLPARGLDSALRIKDTRPYSDRTSFIEFSNSFVSPNKLFLVGVITKLFNTCGLNCNSICVLERNAPCVSRKTVAEADALSQLLFTTAG